MSSNKEISIEKVRWFGTDLGIDWTKIDPEQFRRGLEVELEHGAHDPKTNITGDNLTLTRKIAWVHLKEIWGYYTRLDRMESEAMNQS